MDTGNNGNIIAAGAQAAPVEINPGDVREAAQQMQESVSGFWREDQGYQESLVSGMKQVSGQVRATDVKVAGNRAEIDKLASRIRNYRS